MRQTNVCSRGYGHPRRGTRSGRGSRCGTSKEVVFDLVNLKENEVAEMFHPHLSRAACQDTIDQLAIRTAYTIKCL